MNPHRLPGPSGVMLTVAGLFLLAAAAGTFLPRFVHDRVHDQFIPVWEALTSPVPGDSPNETLVAALARASQWIIGLCELAAAALLLTAATSPRLRPKLAPVGLGLAMGLFGAFLIVLFSIHDRALPWWTQYPPILAWLGVTWLVVLAETRLSAAPHPQQ